MMRKEGNVGGESTGHIARIAFTGLVGAWIGITRALLWLDNQRVQKAHNEITRLSNKNTLSAVDRVFPITQMQTDRLANRVRN